MNLFCYAFPLNLNVKNIMRNVRFWLRSVFDKTILVCSTGDLKDFEAWKKEKIKKLSWYWPFKRKIYASYSTVRTYNSFAVQ